jgi:tRNA nucleotidyltransferase/poly(A) polymerase
MKYIFKPKTAYEKFCQLMLNVLVENSAAVFICGGTARDIILNKKLTDFDIATDLRSTNILNSIAGICAKNKSKIIVYKNFEVVKIFYKKNLTIDISTFRKEAYITVSYPKILFINSPKIDSKRRDFSINSLYISPINGKVLDFNNGLNDLNQHLIKFIGKPENRINEDPFRMVRALRFVLEFKFKIEKKSWLSIKKLFSQKKLGSIVKLQQEILKLQNKNDREILRKIIFGETSLDKVEDKFYYKESK